MTLWRSEPFRVGLALIVTPPVVAAAMVALGLLTISRPGEVLTWQGFKGMFPSLFQAALPGCYRIMFTYGLAAFLLLRVIQWAGFATLAAAGAFCGWVAFSSYFPGRPAFPGAFFGAFGGAVFWSLWKPSRPPSS